LFPAQLRCIQVLSIGMACFGALRMESTKFADGRAQSRRFILPRSGLVTSAAGFFT
jgi:hypothetical protein